MTPVRTKPRTTAKPRSRAAFLRFHRSLQVGERVVETEQSSCMYGITGTVYISRNKGPTYGSKCVMWDTKAIFGGTMGTSVTWGTKRIVAKPKKKGKA